MSAEFDAIFQRIQTEGMTDPLLDEALRIHKADLKREQAEQSEREANERFVKMQKLSTAEKMAMALAESAIARQQALASNESMEKRRRINPMAGQEYRGELHTNDKMLLGLAISTHARGGGPPRRPAA